MVEFCGFASPSSVAPFQGPAATSLFSIQDGAPEAYVLFVEKKSLSGFNPFK